jgi:RNA polymerase sigma factor for flagellar operon FliA
LGLLDAIEIYDSDRPGKKAKLESYAISKIRWAIFDQLRSHDWVPSRVRLPAQEVEKAKTKLIQELRRPPTEAEIAWEVGIKVAEYHDFRDRYSGARMSSLEARLEVDGRPGIEYGAFIEDSSAVDSQCQVSFEELRAQLVDAISRLVERERLVATFYFYAELTLKEIGKALGLTEGRISQILRSALTKLREHLKRFSVAEEDWQAFG